MQISNTFRPRAPFPHAESCGWHGRVLQKNSAARDARFSMGEGGAGAKLVRILSKKSSKINRYQGGFKLTVNFNLSRVAPSKIQKGSITKKKKKKKKKKRKEKKIRKMVIKKKTKKKNGDM